MIMSKKCEECLKGITKQHQEDLDFEKIKTLSEFKEKLKEHIKINGSLSNRIVETEEGEFEHKHDFVLNNIVLEIIEKTSQEITG